MSFCKCLETIDVKQRLFDIVDEIQEFIVAIYWAIVCLVKWAFNKESIGSVYELIDCVYDEWSDIMFGFGRLFGNIRGVVYISMPGDKRHIEKITYLYEKTGCCRSLNHKGCR
jgi:hypothetical protein